MTFFYDMCKILNFCSNEVKFHYRNFTFEWAIALFQAVLTLILQHQPVLILFFLCRHTKIFNSAEWMLKWSACSRPTSWFKSHVLWATEVWADHSLALAFPAWNFPCQLCFLSQIWGIQHRLLCSQSAEHFIGTQQTKTLRRHSTPHGGSFVF